MKKNSTFSKVGLLTFSLLSIFLSKGYAQPDYDFTSGSLSSGTDRTVGAVYRFVHVKPGVDALVTITHISPGVVVANMDDGSGYPEALQPSLDVSPGVDGYLEMNIDFVNAGTSTLMNQLEIPITCIDVDGIAGSVYEYDQITWGVAAYMDYDVLGNELTINSSPGWMSCKNHAGVDYPGRDTAAKQVMFTVVNANRTGVTVRVGADNISTSSNAYRLRSIYFKKFKFSNSLLPAPELSQFSGYKNFDQEITLVASLRTYHSIATVSIEKSSNGSLFSIISTIDANGKNSLQYTDYNKNETGVYYRLKLTDKNGKTGYSNTLFFKANESANTLTVLPSIVIDYTTISIKTNKTGIAKLGLYDQSGRLLLKKDIITHPGTTNYSLGGLARFKKGQYIIVVTAEGNRQSQKIQLTN